MNKLILVGLLVVMTSLASGTPTIAKSEDLIAYINEASGATWKAGPSKFDSWSMKSIKRLMGVPSHHIGRPSSLPLLVHDVDLNSIPGIY